MTIFGKHKQKLKTFEAAEQTLAKSSKLRAAIGAEVARLPALIESRLAAEKQLRLVEAQEATGELQNEGAITKARKSVSDCRAAIDAVATKLRGLRASFVASGAELDERHIALTAELPQYNAALAASFTAEWNAAALAFARVLGKRQAIEGLIGERMALADPIPEAFALGDLGQPQQLLEAIAGAIRRIAAMHHSSSNRVTDGRPYYAERVYVLKRAAGGLAEGTLVVEASLDEGRLETLARLGDAALVRDSDERRGIEHARKAAERISAEEAAARERSQVRDQEQQAAASDITPQWVRDQRQQREEHEERERQKAFQGVELAGAGRLAGVRELQTDLETMRRDA